jgi:4-amino-4-deoxy-L-arabinose transferase-like glycosyltransferase
MITNDWLNIFISFFLAGWFFLLIISVGQQLLKFFSLSFELAVQRLVFGCVFGLSAIWLVLFVLGISQMFDLKFITGLFVLTTLLLFRAFFSTLKDLLEFLKKNFVFWLILLIFYLFFVFFAALTPPHHSEELSYHLNVPQIFAKEGGIINLPNFWQSYLHSHIHLLTTVGFLLTGYTLAKILIVLLNSLAPLAIYIFGSRFFNKRVGLISAVIFFFTPYYTLFYELVLQEIILTLFAVCALYLIFLFLYQSPENKFLYLAAVLLGTGVSIKLNFGFFVVACFILIAGKIFIRFSSDFFSKFKQDFIFSLIILALAAPWLIYNWFYSGFPFFPFWGSNPVGWQTFSVIEIKALNLKHLIQLPWLVTMHSYLGIGLLIFLPFLFFLKNWPKGTKSLLLITFISIALHLAFVKNWAIISIFNFNDFVRYSIFTWPFLMLLAGLVIDQLWQNKNIFIRSGIFLVMFIYLTVWLSIQITFRVPKINWLAKQSRPISNYNDFIYSVLPNYPAQIPQYHRFHPGIVYLNQLINPKIKVLTIDPRIFYLKKPVVVIYGFRELPFWISLSSETEFIDRLRFLDITHLIVPNYSEYYTKPTLNFLKENPQLINQGILNEVYDWPDGRVYQVNNSINKN